MSRYAGARERIIQLNTALVSEPPLRETKPHFLVSPRSAQGLPTEGIALTLIQALSGAALGAGAGMSSPAGSGGAGGFGVALYRNVPGIGGWASLAPFTTSAAYGEQYVLEDISGAWGIYFQITEVTQDGILLIGIAELD